MLFQREAFSKEFFKEAIPLFVEHHDEVSYFKDLDLNVDVDQYQVLEDVGALKIYTAREASGELIGYGVFIIAPHIHYKDLVHAATTALFISKNRRGFGQRFIKFCNNSLYNEGVGVVTQRVTKDVNFAPMLLKSGFEFMEVAYAKVLKGEE